MSSPAAAIAARRAANAPIAFQHLFLAKQMILVADLHLIAHVAAATTAALDPGGGGAPVMLICTGARLYCVELVVKDTRWESAVPPCEGEVKCEAVAALEILSK